ncbi:MAG: acyl-CoA thioesterase [Bacteroidales bacterium]|nr:acyl-CoA thioesterase [Bacteroidales bacterium]
MSKKSFEIEMKVRDYECDAQGIVNNANYQHYYEVTRHEFLESVGISFSDSHDEGIDPVVSRVEIHYKTSLKGGDRFISSMTVERKGVRLIFSQNIKRKTDHALCSTATIDVVVLVNGVLSMGNQYDKVLEEYLKD